MFSRPFHDTPAAPAYAAPPGGQPVDRRRPEPPWADTLPACFRSEAFAEDLVEELPASAPPAYSALIGIFR